MTTVATPFLYSKSQNRLRVFNGPDLHVDFALARFILQGGRHIAFVNSADTDNEQGRIAVAFDRVAVYLDDHVGVVGASDKQISDGLPKISVRLLASLVRHRSIATTQRYIDVNDEMKRRAVELV